MVRKRGHAEQHANNKKLAKWDSLTEDLSDRELSRESFFRSDKLRDVVIKSKIPVIILWVILAIVAAVFAKDVLPHFSTQDAIAKPPSSTGAGKAHEIMSSSGLSKYTDRTHFDVYVAAKQPKYSVVGSPEVEKVSAKLKEIVKKQCPKKCTVNDYWDPSNQYTKTYTQSLAGGRFASGKYTQALIQIRMEPKGTPEEVTTFEDILQAALNTGEAEVLKGGKYPTGLPATFTLVGPAAHHADIYKSSKHDIYIFLGAGIPAALLVAVGFMYFNKANFMFLVPLILTVACTSVIAYSALNLPRVLDVPIPPWAPLFTLVFVTANSICYSAFMIKKFTEEISKDGEFEDSVSMMMARGLPFIMLSSAMITLCFLCMLFAPVPAVYVIGISCSIGQFVSMAAHCTLLPALISGFGGYLFANKTEEQPLLPVKQAVDEPDSALLFVEQRHSLISCFPRTFAVAIVVVIIGACAVGVLGWQAGNYTENITEQIALPRGVASTEGYLALAKNVPRWLPPVQFVFSRTYGDMLATCPQPPCQNNAFTDINKWLTKLSNSVKDTPLSAFSGATIHGGTEVDSSSLLTAMKNPSDKSQKATTLRKLADMINTDKKSSVVEARLNFDPASNKGREWIKAVNKFIEETPMTTNNNVFVGPKPVGTTGTAVRREWHSGHVYLTGFAADLDATADASNDVLIRNGIITASVGFLAIGLALWSIPPAMAALITTSFTICFVMGIGKLIYCDGMDSWAPISPTGSQGGFAWMVMPMMLPVIFGISLYFDVNLLAHVLLDLKATGWPTTPAMAEGSKRSYGMATFSACVYLATFGTMMLSDQPVVNQFATFMILAILFIILILQPILTPGVLLLLAPLGWYPHEFAQDRAVRLSREAQQAQGRGDMEEAEEKYKEALSLFKEARQTYRWEYASTLNNLGTLYATLHEREKGQGHLETALSLYLQSVDSFLELLSTAKPGEGMNTDGSDYYLKLSEEDKQRANNNYILTLKNSGKGFFDTGDGHRQRADVLFYLGKGRKPNLQARDVDEKSSGLTVQVEDSKNKVQIKSNFKDIPSESTIELESLEELRTATRDHLSSMLLPLTCDDNFEEELNDALAKNSKKDLMEALAKMENTQKVAGLNFLGWALRQYDAAAILESDHEMHNGEDSAKNLRAKLIEMMNKYGFGPVLEANEEQIKHREKGGACFAMNLIREGPSKKIHADPELLKKQEEEAAADTAGMLGKLKTTLIAAAGPALKEKTWELVADLNPVAASFAGMAKQVDDSGVLQGQGPMD